MSRWGAIQNMLYQISYFIGMFLGYQKKNEADLEVFGEILSGAVLLIEHICSATALTDTDPTPNPRLPPHCPP